MYHLDVKKEKSKIANTQKVSLNVHSRGGGVFTNTTFKRYCKELLQGQALCCGHTDRQFVAVPLTSIHLLWLGEKLDDFFYFIS